MVGEQVDSVSTLGHPTLSAQVMTALPVQSDLQVHLEYRTPYEYLERFGGRKEKGEMVQLYYNSKEKFKGVNP